MGCNSSDYSEIEFNARKDPWETVLGKAYLCLFNQINDALHLMEQQNPAKAHTLLMLAQRKAEEMMMNCGHPLEAYSEHP